MAFSCIRTFLCVFVFFSCHLTADDLAAKKTISTKADPVVHPAAVPSLVNLTSMPSAVVNGSVNIITGDFCESGSEDVVYSPDPYTLGHTYFSSSLEEGNLGAGWNFLHYHLIEVAQGLISYTKDGDTSIPCLLPHKAFDIFNDSSVVEKDVDRGMRSVHMRSGGHDRAERRDSHENNNAYDGPVSQPDPGPIFLSLYDPSGGRLVYKTKFSKKHKERSMRRFKLESKLTGYTNVVGGRMSGQTNLKNIKLSWDEKNDAFLIVNGDGTKREYVRQWKTKDMMKKDRDYAKSHRDYHLHKETKPNGNVILYDYNDEHEITEIRAYNRDYKHKLYEVEFDQRTTGDFAKNPNLTVTTSDGFGHTYYFKKLKGSYKHGTYSVNRIKRSGHPFTNYIYSKKSPRHKRRVVKKETEGGFYVSTKYYRISSNWMDSKTITPKDKKERTFLRNRVRMQQAPVGPNGQEIITHRYFYYKDDNGGGHCTVRDAHNNISRHYWNKDKRLIRVTKSDANDKRLMSEKYYWGENDTKDEGRLICRVLEDETIKPILAHTFKYDSKGNIVEDAIYARITENSGTLRMEDGLPHHESCDKQRTCYTYTDDGFNLVASSCDPLGNYTYYEYVAGTNLLKAKFVCDATTIKKREFFDYDSCGIVIQHIVDDGSTKEKNDLSDATERHIVKTKPRYERPRFGEPEEIMEFAYNFNEQREVYLNKTVHHYNDKGFVAKRECIDQLGGSVVYEYTYDQVGRITSTKNPLGEVEHIEYDFAGRIKKKTGPKKDFSLHYVYDVAGRLIKETEKQGSLELTSQYQYDNLSRKIAVIDPQNNTTRYEYDALNRVTAIIYSPIYDHEGSAIHPKKTYSYKHLGTQVTEKDENGLVTETIFNALGNICEKKLPDNTKTHYFYDLNGNVVKELLPNGAIAYKEYDAFRRIKRSQLMMQDEVLCKNEVVYNTFHTLVEIGPKGEKTAFSYDYAGRKKSIQRQDIRTMSYVYDARGRVCHEKCMLADDGFFAKSYTYDDLNRITKEVCRDHKKHVRTYKEYGYDIEGNKKFVKQEIDGKRVVSRATFYSHGIAKSKKDAQGNRTQFTYDYFFQNSHGQKVLKKTTIDALGCHVDEIYDTRGNLSESIVYDPQGLVIAKKNLFYDAGNNCIRCHEYALKNGQELKLVVTLFSFKKGQLRSITEAFGTPEEKTTTYIYNEFGQKKSTTFADGTIIRFRYDAKGRVKRYFAADKSLDYHYQYDASDRILSVLNGITGQKTERHYNRFGELKRETLENGLTTGYLYDNAGRITSVTLPDNSKVMYRHSAFLEDITRMDSNGNVRYSHKVAKRDLSGLVKSSKLVNNSKLKVSHDSLGRCKKITHDHFSERVEGFDAVGNLLSLSTKDFDGAYTRTFSYDYLSQLIKEDGHTKHTYSYDSLHNRLSHNDEPYLVNSLHSVLSDSNRDFTYDFRGNRLSMQAKDGQTQYKYDALDRLIHVELPNSTRYEYSYDGFNRRILKEGFKVGALGWIKESTTKYIYALDNEIGSTDAANKICELRILGEGLGAEIGAAVALEFNDTVYTPLHDRQGNVVAVLDDAGQVVEHYRFDAFGNEYAHSASGSNTPINPWRFSSKRVDSETGMINFGRRFYDPTLGKWLTQDPLGLKAGPNLYAYCLNNPMTHFDQYGLFAEDGTRDRTVIDRFKDFIIDGFREVGHGLCRVAESIVHNIIHVGEYNNALEDKLRSYRGAEPKERPTSGLYTVADGVATQTGCLGVALANGIKCTLDEAKESLLELLKEFKNGTPAGYVLYSETKGFCMDLGRALANKLGFTTYNIEPIQRAMEDLVDIVKQSDVNDAHMVIVAHSLGGNSVYQAGQRMSPKLREKFKIDAVGSSKTFHDSHGYKKARNYGGWSDLVPIISDPIGLLSNGLRPDSNVLMAGHMFKIPLLNHNFTSNEYRSVLSHIAKQHGAK